MSICKIAVIALLSLCSFSCNVDEKFDRAKSQCEKLCNEKFDEKVVEIEKIINDNCVTREELRFLFEQAVETLRKNNEELDSGTSD